MYPCLFVFISLFYRILEINLIFFTFFSSGSCTNIYPLLALNIAAKLTQNWLIDVSVTNKAIFKWTPKVTLNKICSDEKTSWQKNNWVFAERLFDLDVWKYIFRDDCPIIWENVGEVSDSWITPRMSTSELFGEETKNVAWLLQSLVGSSSQVHYCTLLSWDN